MVETQLKSDLGYKSEIIDLTSADNTVFKKMIDFATFGLQVTKRYILKIRFVTEETNNAICTYAKIAQVTKKIENQKLFLLIKDLLIFYFF